MRLEAYCAHDAAVGAFLPPFFCRSRGEALRSFQQACSGDGPFAIHGKDYSLYQVGFWSDENGLFEAFDIPDRVAGALDFRPPE